MKHLVEILHEDDKENHLIKEEITTKMEQRLVMKKMMKAIFYCLSAPLDEVDVDVVLDNPALIRLIVRDHLSTLSSGIVVTNLYNIVEREMRSGYYVSKLIREMINNAQY